MLEVLTNIALLLGAVAVVALMLGLAGVCRNTKPLPKGVQDNEPGA